MKQFLTIEAVKGFYKNNGKIYECLKDLITHCINVKHLSFSKQKFQKEYQTLQTHDLVSRESSDSFQLDYKMLPVCYVLSEIAEETLQKKIPDDPINALKFANVFCEEIRKPNVRTWWYSDLEIQLESYLLVYLNQLNGVDVTAFIMSITEEMRDQIPDVRGTDLSYKHAFAYLNDNINQLFNAVTFLLSNDRSKHAGWDSLQNIGLINPGKGLQLYEYSKENGAININGFLPNLLIGLYRSNAIYCLNEAIAFFDENPNQSLLAISWFDYSDSAQITTAFDFITKQHITDTEYMRNSPIFYTRIIENQNTPEGIKQKCFKIIEELTKQEDEILRSNLVWRTSMIKGYDKEKYELLPNFMAWGRAHFLKDYFDHFDSPAYLFELIRQSYLYHGINTDFLLFKEALHGQYLLHQAEFEKQLLQLLADDIAIIRFAGIQILTSRYNGVYNANFLDLDEQHQIRVIETLLPLPVNIEDLLPLTLQLRSSPFENVREKLKAELTELIRAYDHKIIELTSNYLDQNNENDKSLLESLNEAYVIYHHEQEEKNKINEFNPLQNELEYVELFFRLEQEKQAEMMEKAQSQTFIAQIAKNISVIRGGGFKSELNPEISIMGKFSSSRLLDQRYSINPDAYEWNFKMHALTKNYKETSQ